MKKKILKFLGIIFILSLILCITLFLPYLSKRREDARRMSCAGNLVSLGFAFRMYTNAYNGHFPTYDGAEGLELLRINDFCRNSMIYTCPSTRNFLGIDEPLKESNISYIYFGGYTENDPADTIIMCDKTKNHEGYRNILFLDGTVCGYSNGKLKKFTKFKNKYTKSSKVISEKELKKLK